MNNINFNSLKIFFEVANSNSFMEASNRLYLSQPAISKSMAKLEEDLNVSLFYRANKGISLTPSGEILYNYLIEISDLLGTCKRALTSLNDAEGGSLVIGVQSHIVRNYLMDKVDDFRLNHPKVKIELIDMSTNQMVEQLETRKLDFIIDSSPIDIVYNNVSIIPICSLKTCFVKSSMDEREFNTIEDLANENFILPIARSSLRKEINKVFENYGINLKPVLEYGTEELIIESVRRNLGIGYVVEPAIKYLIEAGVLEKINLRNDLPEMQINIVKIDANLTKTAKLFIEEEVLNEK